MFSILVATRRVVNIARYPLSNAMTRSFIACPRVANAKSETGSPKPPSESPAPAKRGRKPKEPKSESTPKPKPKKVAIPEHVKPPKHPKTPYLIFAMEFLEKIPKPSDKEAMQTWSKECGVKWKALPDAEKERYRETYRRDLEEFAQKKAAWFKTIDPEMLKTINASRKASGKRILVDGDKPKSDKPLSAFFQFMRQLRAESADNVGTSIIDFSRHAGEKWRSLSEEEKQTYRNDYEREMSEWRARNAPTEA